MSSVSTTADDTPKATPGSGLLDGLARLRRTIAEARQLPLIEIDLRCAGTAGNDPFFAHAVRRFHREATRRHRKFPLVRNYAYGFSACRLPANFDDYFMSIEGAARRNYKKSCRLGYRFERIEYDDHLQDVTEIVRSTPVRQGKPMPESYFTRALSATRNPPSNSPLHDYPYFGILQGDRLVAYCSCLIAGDLCAIQTIYGHADRQADGVVPMMLIDVARWIMQHHPDVKFYAYGNYYGAGETMRRFKRKFGFLPHRVRWRLGA